MKTEQTNQLAKFAWDNYLTADYEFQMSLDNNSWLDQKRSFDQMISVINHIFETDYPSGREILALQKRFLDNPFCQDHEIKDYHFEHLFNKYTEPHRFYHTLDHIARGLDDIDLVRSELQHPEMVELAWWYHDVIYDTKAKDNEEKSAELLLREGRFSSEEREELKALILGTKSHQNPTTPDQAYLMDIDLKILGSKPEEYVQYTQAVRKEYSWVDGDSFVYARREFLEEFLKRPILFNTEYFRDKYERQARENLRVEIDHLGETIMV